MVGTVYRTTMVGTVAAPGTVVPTFWQDGKKKTALLSTDLWALLLALHTVGVYKHQ